MKNLGIYSVGTYVPSEVRTNDWWPQAIVDKWSEKKMKSFLPTEISKDPELTPAMQAGVREMAALKDDPFKGTVQRRIRPANMKPSDMEIAAAIDAVARAGIDPSEIGLVVNASEVSDSPCVSTAPLIQKAIGAPKSIPTFGVEAVCNGFMMQLQLAQGLIQSGQIEYALLTQSCMLSSLVRPEDSFSPWFGDVATAVLVGPCDPSLGLQAMTHASEPDFFASMLLGNPDGPWWDGHAPRLYLADAQIARHMAMLLPQWATRSIETTLGKIGKNGADIDFLATHQATGWLRPLVQDLLGAKRSKSADTFKWSASVGPANIPLCLATADRDGLLQDGDLVAGWTGGAGTTNSSFALRWGH